VTSVDEMKGWVDSRQKKKRKKKKEIEFSSVG
jgi:hypothetical protein